MKSERKFRNRGDYTERKVKQGKKQASCGKCGKEVVCGEPLFVRRDKWEKLGRNDFLGCDVVRVHKKTKLCVDCVLREEVVEEDKKYLDDGGLE